MPLRTGSTLGVLGLAVGGDVTPLSAPQAKCVWSPLLEGIDLVAASWKPYTSLAELVKNLLAQNSSHNRRTAALLAVKSGSRLGPTQPPDFRWDSHPSVFCLKLLAELPKTTSSSHVPVEGDVVDSDPLPSLLGG